MAGSRAEKLVSLFSRASGLLRTGALKLEDKPLWYDVYAAFPPQVEPKYNRFVSAIEPPDILYREDSVRAYFYKTFITQGVIDMKSEEPSLSQRFISEYKELGGSFDNLDEDLLMHAALNIRNAGHHLKTFKEVEEEKALKLQKITQDASESGNS